MKTNMLAVVIAAALIGFAAHVSMKFEAPMPHTHIAQSGSPTPDCPVFPEGCQASQGSGGGN
jgi:hypothetical protein